MLVAWERNYPRASNTELLTKFTPVLDADILDEAAAIAVEDLITQRFEERGYILPRIGRPPKRAIPFRTLTPFPKITANLIATDGSTGEKVELLCDGQQFVAAGIHPDTKKPYAWPLGNPVNIAHDDLPEINETEAKTLVEDIVTLSVVTSATAARRAARVVPASGSSEADRRNGNSFTTTSSPAPTCMPARATWPRSWCAAGLMAVSPSISCAG